VIKGWTKIFSSAAAVWVLIGGLTGCAGKRPGDFPPPPAIASSSTVAGSPVKGVRVSLSWSAPVDLDLYVTDPALETVYFANDRSQSGGRLERDVTCETVRSRHEQIEEIRWADPAKGRYRVGVDFMDDCGAEIGQAEFRIRLETRDERREVTGRIVKARFDPVVVEFEVP